MSLLGAVAWVLQTRVDIAVFVSALQRHSGKCKHIHVKRLNAVVRYLQREKRRLWYHRLGVHQPGASSALQATVDSAFKKEDDSGHAMRGALFLRSRTGSGDFGPRGAGEATLTPHVTQVHVIDVMCGKHRHVLRSTFGAELVALGVGVDHMLMLA